MPLNETEVKRSLDNAVKDGACYSAMVGVGESYVNPAALFMGARDVHLGMLTSIPQLAGAFFQIISAEVVDRFRHRRRVYLGGALIQALTWIPMTVALFLSFPMNIYVLIFSFSIYVMALNYSSTAWVSTVGDLVPDDQRGRYFGRRNMICGLVHVVTLVGAGIFLHVMEHQAHEREAFVILFVLALAARLASSFFLSRMTDPPYVPRREDYFTLWDFIRRSPASNFAQYVFFVTVMYFGIALIGPFIVAYQLRDLKMSYFEFTLASIVHFLSMYLTMMAWGRLADRIGNRRVMTICSIGLVLVPFMWSRVFTLPAMLAVQVFAGVVWAGFGLSTANFIFDAVSPAKRARCFAYFTLFTALALFAGAAVGGVLADHLGTTLRIGALHIEVFFNLQWLMIISGVCRLVTVLVFLPRFREVRDVDPISTGELIMRVAFLVPLVGHVFEVFWGGRSSNKNSSGDPDA